ncbi:MAG TPA: carbohydrate ABC transporter permease [Oscillospiraceae bacterium]|nr:carbohydrate ABC transporter permease [Oscillospiraceae bacterium]
MNESAIHRARIKRLCMYAILLAVAIVMLYPIVWLFGASFKSNAEIHSSIGFIPSSFSMQPYINGWNTGTEYTMGHYFINTFEIVIPRVLFTIVSVTLVAYGFARFKFPFKKQFFALLIGTLLLPQVILRIPSYLMWREFHLLDTFAPLTLPHLFATDAFFVFMLIQFFRGIPKDLDEAAKIDGCSRFSTLIRILVPCIKPAIISIGLFSFMWAMNDFMGPLIFISSVEKYPVTIALRMSMDATGSAGYEENQIIAMSIVSLIPSIVVFMCAQKQFVDGITTGSVKG